MELGVADGGAVVEATLRFIWARQRVAVALAVSDRDLDRDVGDERLVQDVDGGLDAVAEALGRGKCMAS